jgi:hypothetical protein
LGGGRGEVREKELTIAYKKQEMRWEEICKENRQKKNRKMLQLEVE